MSKLKDRIIKAKSMISIKTYKRPLIYILILMVLLNLLILLIAAGIAMVIDDQFTNFFDAFANGSVKWMLAPNAILSIQNPNLLILAVCVLVTGIILFSGTIIALTTNAIKEYVQKKNSGSGKVHLDQHIVVLNWNSKVPELVSDLLFIEKENITVMILADIEKSYAERQIVNAIQKNKKIYHIAKLNVLVKNGDPLLRSDLLDIAIERSTSILIMNPDKHETIYKDMSKSDLAVLKVILGLGSIEFVYDPPIVVEIKHIESRAKIMTLAKVVENLRNHLIMPICFDMRLGQIIAQTLIENRIEDVYLALFSFKGSEIYALHDQTFDQCLKENSHAIPLSQRDETLFVLSEDNEIKNRKSSHLFEPISLKTKKWKEVSTSEIYIIGKNNKLRFILDSLKQYEKIHHSQFHAEWIEDDKIHDLVRDLNQTNRAASILLLSDETQEEDSLDANVIDNLIYLEGQLSNKNIHIIVELLNPKNDPIVKNFNIKNTIISNKIISLLLTKLALYKETAPFYDDLLTIEPDADQVDELAISIVEAQSCLSESFPLVFQSKKQFIQSIYLSMSQTYMVLGYFHQDELMILEDDLHRPYELTLEATDRMILIRI